MPVPVPVGPHLRLGVVALLPVVVLAQPWPGGWSTFCGDNARTCRSNATGVPTNRVAWSVDLRTSPDISPLIWVPPPPAATGSRAGVTPDWLIVTAGYNFSVLTSAGELVWTRTYPWGGESTSPSVARDGALYIAGSQAGAVYGTNVTYAGPDWAWFPSAAAFGTTLITRDNLALVPLYDGSINALNSDGGHVWSIQVDVNTMQPSNPMAEDDSGALYVLMQGSLLCINGSTRATIWSTALPGVQGIAMGPAVGSHAVYVAALPQPNSGMNGSVYAISRDTGRVQWAASTGSDGFGPCVMALGQRDQVFLTCNFGDTTRADVIAFDASGNKLWQTSVPDASGSADPTGSVVDAAGALHVFTMRSGHCISATGSIQFAYPSLSAGWYASSPAIAPDGTLYVHAGSILTAFAGRPLHI